MIYSTKFDSMSNSNVILRLTHDPTNSLNAALRSTQNLCQTATNAIGIDTRSHDEPEKLWYHLLRAGVTTNEKLQPTEKDTPEKYPKDKNN